MRMRRIEKNLEYTILTELKKKDNYLSGEELADKLAISRQALWKHMAKLADKGYEIIAVPHLGYKLTSCPDKLYPWEIQYNLGTRFIGKDIYHKETVDSTQNIAWRLGMEGADEGTVVCAEIQTKGRGRIQRQWVSPRGGVYFSILLRPKFLLIQEVPRITLLIALGCIYGIKKAAGIECSVKWPNDIFLNGKKLGGILCEIHAETDKVHFVVAGIGININTKNLPPRATSLFLNQKKKFCRVEIVKRTLEQIEIAYCRAKKEGFSRLLGEWEQFCLLWGKRVKAKAFNKEIEGEAVGINEQGYLLLRRDTGFIEKISAGDVV